MFPIIPSVATFLFAHWILREVSGQYFHAPYHSPLVSIICPYTAGLFVCCNIFNNLFKAFVLFNGNYSIVSIMHADDLLTVNRESYNARFFEVKEPGFRRLRQRGGLKRHPWCTPSLMVCVRLITHGTLVVALK